MDDKYMQMLTSVENLKEISYEVVCGRNWFRWRVFVSTNKPSDYLKDDGVSWPAEYPQT
jgi:hypothetical protein